MNTNKIDLIKAEVARIQLYTQSEVLKDILDYIDKVQEEPVSEDLEETAYKFVMDNFGNPKEPLYKFDQRCFKAGAQWQKEKDESTTEDLGEYINELSKQFPEVSFAKLSRIAVRVSRWQRNQDVKNKLPKVTDRTELDEYAYQCAYDMSNDWMIENPTWDDVEDACKLGAKWKEKYLTKDATEVTVHIDAGGYPYIPELELYDYDKDIPLAKEGDKYKVVLIKKE